MAIRQRIITGEDLDGFSLEEMECISCSGACGSKVYALRDGKPFVLCGNNQETADFLVSFNGPEGVDPSDPDRIDWKPALRPEMTPRAPHEQLTAPR